MMHPDQPIDRLGIIWGKKEFKGAEPPESVCRIEYPFTPELMYHAYYFFQDLYDGFEMDVPKHTTPTPHKFSLTK